MTRHENFYPLLSNKQVVISYTASVVEFFVRNPYRSEYKMLCFSKKNASLVLINFSKVLDKQGKSDNGQQFDFSIALFV